MYLTHNRCLKNREATRLFDSLEDAKLWSTPAGGPNVILNLDDGSDEAWVKGSYPDCPAQWFRTTKNYAKSLM